MKAFLIFFSLIVAATSYSGETAVIYIRTGDTDIDPGSIQDLGTMVTTLNRANAGSGHTYKLYIVPTFESLSNLILSPETTGSVGVAHGVFVSGHYTGNVKEVGGAQPESDVKDRFMRFAHCDENRKIDADDIGAICAGLNGDKYPGTGGTEAPAPGSAPTAGATPVYGNILVGYWVEIGSVNGVVVSYNITPVYQYGIIGYKQRDPMPKNVLAASASPPGRADGVMA